MLTVEETIMKYIIICFMVASLAITGCGFTTSGDAFESSARGAAAKAYDAGLVNAEQFVCNDTSVGSVKRRYLKTPGEAEIYNNFCNQSGKFQATPKE